MATPGASRCQAPVPLPHHPEGVASFLKVATWAKSAARAPATICGMDPGHRSIKRKEGAKEHLSRGIDHTRTPLPLAAKDSGKWSLVL